MQQARGLVARIDTLHEAILSDERAGGLRTELQRLRDAVVPKRGDSLSGSYVD